MAPRSEPGTEEPETERTARGCTRQVFCRQAHRKIVTNRNVCILFDSFWCKNTSFPPPPEGPVPSYAPLIPVPRCWNESAAHPPSLPRPASSPFRFGLETKMDEKLRFNTATTKMRTSCKTRPSVSKRLSTQRYAHTVRVQRAFIRMWKLWWGAAALPQEDFKLAPNCRSRKTGARVQGAGPLSRACGRPLTHTRRPHAHPCVRSCCLSSRRRFKEWEKAKTTRRPDPW